MEVNYESEKNVIECLIYSFKKPVSIYIINKEYEQHCGKPIPYLQLGFTSLENFITSLDENISSRYSCNGTLLFYGRLNHKAEHVKNLIDGQKTQNYRSKYNDNVKQKPSRDNFSSRCNAFKENRYHNKFGRKVLHFQVQQRIKALLNFHPKGLSAENFRNLYNEEYIYYKDDLDFHYHGYDSLEELLSSCSTDVLTFEGSLKNRVFYPKIRLDDSQITKTIETSLLQCNGTSDSFFEEVENNRIIDEVYVTFQIDSFKNVLTFSVEVGEVYSALKFYVLIKSFSTKLDELNLEMKDYYMKNDNVKRWRIKMPDILFEQPVAVYYKEEETFYRGIITQIIGVETVQVYLVDYGTNAQVNNSDLLYLHKKFFDLPAQAINATLHNLELSNQIRNNANKASFKFLELVQSFESLTAKVFDVDVKNYLLSIEIFGDDSISINEILVDEGYCANCKNQQSRVLLPQDSNVKEEITSDKFWEKGSSSPLPNYSQVSAFPIGKLSPIVSDEEIAVKEPFNQDANLKCNYSEYQHHSQELVLQSDGKQASIEENEEAGKCSNEEVNLIFNYDPDFTRETASQTNETDAYFEKNEEAGKCSNEEVNLIFNYDPDFTRETASQTKETDACFEKSTLVDVFDHELKVCSNTDSIRNNSTTDKGFLSSSDEKTSFTVAGPNSLDHDLLFKALMSLESARTFIKHKRRQIFSQLSEDSSLNSIYINLSTMKANIVALETELKGMIRNS